MTLLDLIAGAGAIVVTGFKAVGPKDELVTVRINIYANPRHTQPVQEYCTVPPGSYRLLAFVVPLPEPEKKEASE